MTGAGWGVGGQHNHNLEAMFVHAPGLKVVMPSNAADFKGLLKAAIRDDNPVLFFMDLALGHAPGDVPEGEHVVPLGQADVAREGIDVTLVSYAKTVATACRRPTRCSHAGHRRRGDRPAHAQAARRGDDPALGAEDRPG